MSAMMAPALAKSKVAMAGSISSRLSRRRNSSALIAQISLSISCSLRKVGEELGDLGISCIGHVAEPRAFASSSDCGEISLGAVPRSVGAVAVGPAAAFVGLHQRTSHDLLDRGKAAHELMATLAQRRG